MEEQFIRTEMVLGKKAVERLAQSTVAVFGIGGVGSFAAEGLARAGIGGFLLVDNDVISVSNINRQIHADWDTVGRYKTEIMAERIARINPQATVALQNKFFLSEKEADWFPEKCDYIVDAIDTVTGKIELVLMARRRGIPVISSMGTGNKLHPERLELADIYETSVCPLAKVMRRELKKRNVPRLRVVYSKEEPRQCRVSEEELMERGEKTQKRRTPGSISFVPSVAGLIIAGEVVREIAEVK